MSQFGTAETLWLVQNDWIIIWGEQNNFLQDLHYALMNYLYDEAQDFAIELRDDRTLYTMYILYV